MQLSHLMPRGIRLGVITALLIGVLLTPISAPAPVSAQSDNPAAEIEALALNLHHQNLRMHSFTEWIGGQLGNPINAPRRTALADRIDDWTLTGFAGDEDIELDTLERPVLLNFWASWCGPCRVEFPHLSSVATAPDAHNFDVIFVNMSDNERDAREFLAGYPEALTTTIDQNDRLALRASIESIPTSLLVDTDGTVLIVHVGPLTPTVTDFFDAVAANPGEGTFIAADHMDDATGANLAPIDVEEALPLTPGEPVQGDLDDEQFQQAYRFEGRTGDIITVILEAGDSEVDPYLVLMTAEGERLAENDDVESGIITDSALSVTLPEDGTYIVVATRFLEAEGFSSGSYTLTLMLDPADTPGDSASAAAESDQPGTVDQGGWVQREGDGFVRYNTTIAGEVSGINPRALLAFDGRENDVVSLRVTHDAAGAPLTIEIKDPDLNRLIESEPSQRGGVELSNLTLPSTGIYRITVYRERARDQEWMAFDLTLTLVDSDAAPSTPLQQSSNLTLAYGDTGSATISDAEYEQRWSFEGTAGDMVTIEMARTVDQAGELDGYLILEGPDGDTLLEIDDTNESVMPAIEAYILPGSGTYTIVATRFGFASGFSTGEYTITLRKDAASSDPITGTDWLPSDDLPADLRLINYNETVTGTIDDDNVDDWYTFQGNKGDAISINMDAQNIGNSDAWLDSFLILTTASGIELAQNDDSMGYAGDAAISSFILPATDTYLIRATRYGFENGPTHGDYELKISAFTTNRDSAEIMTLNYGDIASGDVSFDSPIDRYTFEGHIGEQVTIRVAGGEDLLPVLVLRDPDGNTLVSDINSAGEPEAVLLRVPLPEDGDYTVEVIPKDLNTGGTYTLLLLGHAMPEIDPGAFEPAPDTDLEFVLLWSSGADLDLSASAPANAADAVRSATNDLCQDVTETPVERLAWATGSAEPGRYTVTIAYRHNCTAQQAPVTFILALARNGEVIDLIGGTLAREGDLYTTTVTYDR